MPNYLNPSFFLAAWVIAVPLLLHLLRPRKRRQQKFPSLFFLTSATRSTQSSRWRRRAILLARCAALLFLAAAFARPYFGAQRPDGSATVIVVDQSFSLQTKGRWEELHRWVDQQLGHVDPEDSTGLVSTRPQWLEPLSTNSTAVRRSFDQLQPGWGTAKIEPAVRLAADVLSVSPARERRIIVMTDHQQVAWAGTDFARKLPAGIKVIFPEPAAVAKNQVALSAALIEASHDSPEKWRASVKVTSFSNVVQNRRLKVFRENDAQPLAEVTLHLAPREVSTQPWPLTLPPQTRWIRFVLDPDELPVDDVAYALVPAAGEQAGMVYFDPSPAPLLLDYPRTALTSMAELTPAFRAAALPLQGEWPPRAGIILRHASSFAGESGGHLDAFLQAGGAALVFLDAEVAASPWWLSHGVKLTLLPRATDPVSIHDWTIDHPLVSPLSEYGLRSLLGWQFRIGWELPRSRTEPIGWWENGSIAVGEITLGAGKLLICGFPADRRAGDWVTDEAFVPFLHRALEQITHSDQRTPAAAHLVGEPIVLPAGPGGWRAVSGPGIGQTPSIVEHQVTPSFPGIYRFDRGSESTYWSVQVPSEESDLTPWPNGLPWWQLQSTATKDAEHPLNFHVSLNAQEAEEKDGRWWWCMAILGTFFLLELLLANRTTR